MKSKSCFYRIILFTTLVALVGCEKEILPIVYINYISEITSSSAGITYQITFEGNSEFTASGICWADVPGASVNDNKFENSNSVGEYYVIISDLDPNKKYYVRAYGINNYGINYSSESSFTTREKFVVVYSQSPPDGDGIVYKTVKIGEQEWFAENLKTTSYSDGSSIATTEDPFASLQYVSEPSFQWAYDGDENMVDTYGRLYTWWAISDEKGVCPDGWHVPTNDEWSELYETVGGVYIAGGILKEEGTAHWVSPNVGATNEAGFTALPAGYRDPSGWYDELGYTGVWWTSSNGLVNGFDVAWVRFFVNDYASAGDANSYATPNYGYSVRCIKN